MGGRDRDGGKGDWRREAVDVAGVALMAGSARSEGGGAKRKRNGWGGKNAARLGWAGWQSKNEGMAGRRGRAVE